MKRFFGKTSLYSAAFVIAASLVTIVLGNTNVLAQLSCPPELYGDCPQGTTPTPSPTCSLSSSSGSSIIAYDGNVTLTWTTTNATSVTASSSPNNSQWNGAITPVSGGSRTITGLKSTTTFTLSVSGLGGTCPTKLVTVLVGNQLVPTATLDATSKDVPYGGATTLKWTTENVTSCTASSNPVNSQWAASTPISPISSGNISITNLTQTTTFYLNCFAGGSTLVPKQVTVTVGGQLLCNLKSSSGSASIPYDKGSVTLSWTASNATSLNAYSNPSNSQWNGALSPLSGGSVIISGLKEKTTFTLTATGLNQPNCSEQVMVLVDSPPPKATVSLKATPQQVGYGQPTKLEWTTTNATDCTASNDKNNSQWNGQKPASIPTSQPDTQTLTLYENTTFVLQCSGPGGKSDPASVPVGVDPPPPTITIINTGPSNKLEDVRKDKNQNTLSGEPSSWTLNITRSGSLSKASVVNWTLQSSGWPSATVKSSCPVFLIFGAGDSYSECDFSMYSPSFNWNSWDYASPIPAVNSGQVNFAPGESTKSVVIYANNDTTYEPQNEYFQVCLSGAVGGDVKTSNACASGGIIDNDSGCEYKIFTGIEWFMKLVCVVVSVPLNLFVGLALAVGSTILAIIALGLNWISNQPPEKSQAVIEALRNVWAQTTGRTYRNIESMLNGPPLTSLPPF